MSEIDPVYATDVEYHVRYIERVKLGTSYATVVRHLLNLVNRPAFQKLNPTVAIDYVGVGRGVYDLAEEAGIQNIKTITATGGENIKDDDPHYHVPKSELAATLKALFGRGILRIAPSLPESELFTQELKAYVVKRSDSGTLKYEAGVGHDDLISALEMACWIAQQYYNPLAYLDLTPIEVPKEWNDQTLRHDGGMSRSDFQMTNRGNKW
jgi:hypothetical protein